MPAHLPLKRSPLALYTSLFCLGLMSQTAVAADASIERIIVTGSRSAESIEEVPSSVTLIDNKTLAQDMLITSELQNMLEIGRAHV